MQRLRALAAAHPRRVFLLLNLLLFALSMVTLGRGEAPSGGVWITGPAILLLQAGPFLRARTRSRQIAILYLGFLAFCWSMTLFDLGDLPREVSSFAELPAALAGLVLRGFAFALFGHLFGLPWLVVAMLVNLLLFRPAERRAEPAFQPTA